MKEKRLLNLSREWIGVIAKISSEKNTRCATDAKRVILEIRRVTIEIYFKIKLGISIFPKGNIKVLVVK